MIALFQLGLIFFSGILIAIADSIIKKITLGGSFTQAFFHPWMIAVYVLYLVQIAFAVLVFVYQKELGIYSNLFLVFYSVSTVAIGYFFFKEHLSLIQYAGVALALVGVYLMNSH